LWGQCDCYHLTRAVEIGRRESDPAVLGSVGGDDREARLQRDNAEAEVKFSHDGIWGLKGCARLNGERGWEQLCFSS
jgi:hypothetical protein